jgi:hypothetical protein
MPEWEEAAPSVIHTAETLVKKYHPELRFARLGFVFHDQARRTGGRLVKSGVNKVQAKDQVFMEFDFLIWVSKEDWEGKMTDEEREIILDHELTHCARHPSTGVWIIRPHDIQEFYSIIERYQNLTAPFPLAIQTELALEPEGKVASLSSEDIKNISGAWETEQCN